jgi:hypothetical protein
MKTHIPSVDVQGPVAFHDQACAVLHGEPAVYELGTGTFSPSWKAQRAGWFLGLARTRLQKFVARKLFGANT